MEKMLELDQEIFVQVANEAITLRASKLQDYGQSYKNFGVLGVAVRMDDKMSRIKNLLKTGKVNHESLRDSFIDIANYSLMACMILDEEAK